MVPIDILTPHPRNPRHDLGDLRELTNSIRSQGVLSPLVSRAAAGTADWKWVDPACMAIMYRLLERLGYEISDAERDLFSL